MTTDNRQPAGLAGRRDRRPPTIELGAAEFTGARRAAISWLPLGFLRTLAIAGAALALLAVVIVALWPSGDNDVSVPDARLARLEQQMRDFAGRPAPPNVDAAVLNDLSGRLAKLEAEIATPRAPATDPALVNRIVVLEAELKSIMERVGALARRGDEIAVVAGDARGRGDANATALAEFAQRIARLGQAGVTGGETGDRAVRLAVIAAGLRVAVERGEPFATELAAAKSLATDSAVLAPLEPFAASGVPAVAALARELRAVAATLAQAPVAPARDGGGILERLQANAEKLVRVRPVEEIAGDDSAAVIARIEARAAQSDLTGALTELAKLPAELRAGARAWIAKAEARNAAVELSRRFAADAVAALAKPSP
jgi:hypothetical protein